MEGKIEQALFPTFAGEDRDVEERPSALAQRTRRG
jgi:hypothetical protein